MVQRIIGVLLLVAASAFAEGGGAVSFDASAVDGTKLDLAEARFSFAAPCTFLVSGVVYDGVSYSALLEYDGARTLKVREATDAFADAFSSLDLSHAFLAAAEGAVALRNVLIDGYAYTLDVTQVAKNPAALSLAERSVSDVPIAAVRVVPSTAAREAEAAAAASVAAAAAATAKAEAAATVAAAASAREVETLKAALADKEKEIASLKEKQATVVAAATTAPSMAAGSAAAASTATAASPASRETALLSGLVPPANPFGAWTASDAGLAQTDASQLFAKYPAAVDQSANELVYRLSMKSPAREGWVGGGIHILASGATAADGWGFGRSLLVWITRDPKTYGDAKTRLQVYVSSGPVEMTAVSTTQVVESLNDETAVEITVRRDAGTIAVALGGDRKLLYTAPAPLPAGDKVALRSLGPMLFTRFWMGTR